MTEQEIKHLADVMAADIIDLLQKRGAKLPSAVVLVIPLGVAAALYKATGQSRHQAISMLNQAFDDIEGKN